MLPTMNYTLNPHPLLFLRLQGVKQASLVSPDFLFQSLTVRHISPTCCQGFLSAALLLVIQIPWAYSGQGSSQSPPLGWPLHLAKQSCQGSSALAYACMGLLCLTPSSFGPS